MSRRGIWWSANLVTEIPAGDVEYHESFEEEDDFDYDQLSPDDPEASRYVNYVSIEVCWLLSMVLISPFVIFPGFSRRKWMSLISMNP
jgi:hypothetical protein